MIPADASVSKSSYRKQLDRGFRTLRFEEPLEREYRASTLDAGLSQLRLMLTIGLLFGFSIPLLDYFVDGSGFSTPSILYRAALTQPLILMMIVASVYPRLRGYLTGLGVLVALSIGIPALFSPGITTSSSLGSSLTGYAVLVFYTYLFLGLRFRPALVTAVVISACYLAAALIRGAPASALGYSTLWLTFANLIGASGLYNLEYTRRLSFLEARQLRHIATRDALTGIANRKYINEHLTKIWRHCWREQLPLSLVLLDIDHFKAYNDNFGHQAGDDCLIEIARVLDGAGRRPMDLAGRFGGEEFILILPDCALDDAVHLVERLRQEVKSLDIDHPKSSTGNKVTVSAGIAQIFPGKSKRSAQGLIQLADEALYNAKNSGRDRIKTVEAERAETMETGIFELTG